MNETMTNALRTRGAGPRRALCALSLVLMTAAGCPASDDGASEDAGSTPVATCELTGVWKSTELTIALEADGARLVAFQRPVTGRQHFDVGQLWLKDLQRTSPCSFQGKIASFETAAPRPTASSTLHIVGVSYEPVTVTRSVTGLLDVETNGHSTLFSSTDHDPTAYEYGGACESKVTNIQGNTLYYCDDSGAARNCGASAAGETKFWENTTCSQLGYGYQRDEPAQFQHDSSHNGLPGEHGQWGDKTGGSHAGFADGSGGSALGPVPGSTGAGTGGAGGGVAAAGAGGGAPAAGAGGGGTAESWHYVQSDRPIKTRAELVRRDGDKLILRLYYDVWTDDPAIYCGCGYRLYAYANAATGGGLYEYSITFANGSYVYPKSQIGPIDEISYTPVGAEIYDPKKQWVMNGGSYVRILSACVDELRGDSRCTSYNEGTKYPK
jgi:hypothetical protein